MKYIKTSLFTLVASAVLAGCSSTPVTPPASTTAAPPPSTSPAPRPDAGAAPAPASTVASVVIPAHKDPKSAISTERSVYFDYDDFTVKSEYGAVIERQGKYLQAHPDLAIRIEGSADERGSAEYNLALGQKRAEAVLRALKIYGVKDSQLEAVSYGEEKPKSTSRDEAAWAQNRRADIAYRN